MAKNNNFKDFVNDIANAIRLRYGTDEKINPQEFYQKIIGLSGLIDDAIYEIKSVEQFIKHIGNAIKKGYSFSNDEKINPQDYYELILKLNIESYYITREEAYARRCCVV